jgi:hypothetical protein
LKPKDTSEDSSELVQVVSLIV